LQNDMKVALLGSEASIPSPSYVSIWQNTTIFVRA
jgi:hypothetical protein